MALLIETVVNMDMWQLSRAPFLPESFSPDAGYLGTGFKSREPSGDLSGGRDVLEFF